MAEKSFWTNPWTCGVGGCCAGCIILPIAVVSIFGVGVFGFLRSSDAFQLAIEQARNHPEVIQRLGEPIEAGWIVSGNLQIDDKTSRADMQIPVSGPDGSGKLHVKARKIDGEWSFEELVLYLDDSSESIDLLGGATRPTAVEDESV